MTKDLVGLKTTTTSAVLTRGYKKLTTDQSNDYKLQELLVYEYHNCQSDREDDQSRETEPSKS